MTQGGTRRAAGGVAALASLTVLGACGGNDARALAESGKGLAREKACISCHTTDGTPSLGPTWKGLAGSKVILDDGTTVVADDDYLRESILHPSRRTVKEFKPGLMETVIKENALSAEEVDALIAYIKTLR